jgi:hypothetical protein
MQVYLSFILSQLMGKSKRSYTITKVQISSVQEKKCL